MAGAFLFGSGPVEKGQAVQLELVPPAKIWGSQSPLRYVGHVVRVEELGESNVGIAVAFESGEASQDVAVPANITESESELLQFRLASVLHEFYTLLEEYAPAWYTPEHRQRAESVLKLFKRS